MILQQIILVVDPMQYRQAVAALVVLGCALQELLKPVEMAALGLAVPSLEVCNSMLAGAEVALMEIQPLHPPVLQERVVVA
ncbi:hypothetical protein PHIN9_13250 [Polynucleobacter sp. HIN9]|nr:hypothetical protein PHIN9_13250 [Polynucleobacter sp. HIN9]